MYMYMCNYEYNEKLSRTNASVYTCTFFVLRDLVTLIFLIAVDKYQLGLDSS